MTKTVHAPHGWRQVRLRDVALVNPRCKSVSDDTSVTFLPMNAVSESGKINGGETRKAIDLKTGFTSFEDGDVLVAKITPCFENYKGCLCSNLANSRGYGSTEFHVIRPLSEITGEYLHLLTRTHHFRGAGELNMTGTAGQKRVPTIFLQNYTFPLPPLNEQKEISILISIWDKAIEETARLVSAKQSQYRHLVQELIHRMDGHADVMLHEIAKPITTKNAVGETNVLTSSAEHGLISQLEYYKKSVSAEDVSGYYLLERGDFAYNRSSATGYPYGAIKRLDRYDRGVLSTLYLCFRLTNTELVDSNYLADLFEAGVLNRQLRGICQAGARSHGLLNVTKADFFSLKIPLPSIGKQKEIAAKLDLARREIEVLESLQEKYELQKRGLMQKLLTGEWRLNRAKEVA